MAKKKVFSIGSALSRGLEETIESAQNYSGELRVDVIPIKKIELDPDNPRNLALNMTDVQNGIKNNDAEHARKTAELESLRSIANSIKSQGIINPITVYKFGEHYRLIAGERRTLASIMAGKVDIQAKILDDKPDNLKISLLQWIENIERSDLTLWERLGNLEKIVSAYTQSKGLRATEISGVDLSNLLGCTKSHAMNFKALINSDSELRQLIFENKIKNLEKAALISNLDDSIDRSQVIEACINGATLKQMKSLVEQKSRKILPLETERRGRRTATVNFGMTANKQAAKIVIEALMDHKSLSSFSNTFENTDWDNFRSMSETFKNLLKTLERMHS